MIDRLRSEQASIPIANNHEIISEFNKESNNEMVSLKVSYIISHFYFLY